MKKKPRYFKESNSRPKKYASKLYCPGCGGPSVSPYKDSRGGVYCIFHHGAGELGYHRRRMKAFRRRPYGRFRKGCKPSRTRYGRLLSNSSHTRQNEWF